MTGANNVESRPIETSSATSPPDKKDITLEDVPEGADPTKITPTAAAPVNPNKCTSKKAMKGIIT